MSVVVLLLGCMLLQGQPDSVAAAGARARKDLQAEGERSRREIERLEGEIESLARARMEEGAARDRLLRERRALEGALDDLREEAAGLRGRLHERQRDLDSLDALARDRAARLAKWIERTLPDDSTRDALRERAANPAGEDPAGRLVSLLGVARDLHRMAGTVELYRARVRERDGYRRDASVLRVGFVAGAYRTDGGGVGFLLPGGGGLGGAGGGPAWVAARRGEERDTVVSLFESLESGAGAGAGAAAPLALPVDVSRILTPHRLAGPAGPIADLRRGGPVMIPLLALGLLGFALVMERALFLYRRRAGPEGILAGIETLVRRGRIGEAAALCRGRRGEAAQVCARGLEVADEGREGVGEAVHQAILARIPRLERCLSTIAVLASLAPLLGLLGTVTGMIRVFGVITGVGVGDPKVLSGGISEALLTTQVGLAMAVPLLFFHSLLAGRADRIVGEMEQASGHLKRLLQGGGKP